MQIYCGQYSDLISICLNNGRYYTPSVDQLFYKIFRQSPRSRTYNVEPMYNQ